MSANSSSVLFVGGVHGVGKTTLCSKSFAPAGYHCVTASSLIAEDQKQVSKKGDKRVDDVGGNQAAMLRQFSVERGRHSRLLLDGHFTLVNSLGEIEPIHAEVFKAIDPDLLILIKGSSNEISKRLSERDKKHWSVEFVDYFQAQEERHAGHIAKNLGIPLLTINNDIGYGVVVKMANEKLASP